MATIPMSSNASAWKGEISWSCTQNVNNNTSTITASVGTWKTDGSPSSALSGAYFTGKLYVGDKHVDFDFQQHCIHLIYTNKICLWPHILRNQL